MVDAKEVGCDRNLSRGDFAVAGLTITHVKSGRLTQLGAAGQAHG